MNEENKLEDSSLFEEESDFIKKFGQYANKPLSSEEFHKLMRDMRDFYEQKLITSLKGKKKISISYLQRTFGYGFSLSKRIFDSLVGELISSDGTVLQDKVDAYLGNTDVKHIKIIFLDVDGVLNCHSTKDRVGEYTGIDDKKVSLLKEIVDKTLAKIVLVSSWKNFWFKEKELKTKQDEFANRLDEKLAKQGLVIVDKTEDTIPARRGEGILHYIEEQARNNIIVDKYVILDDETWDYTFEHIAHHLVQSSYYQNGLEDKHIRKAIEKLC